MQNSSLYFQSSSQNMYNVLEDEEPCFRAQVLWFMRLWELPPRLHPKNKDEQEIFLCTANYETMIDLETIIEKCEVCHLFFRFGFGKIASVKKN